MRYTLIKEMGVHIITKRRILQARSDFPHAASALEGWFKIVEKNTFKNFSELKRAFNKVDKVGALYVFDFGRNKMKLIASILFNRQKLNIRYVLSHKEYDEGKWRI